MKQFNLFLLLLTLTSCGNHFGRYQGIKLQRNNSTKISKDVSKNVDTFKSLQEEELSPNTDLLTSTSEGGIIYLPEPQRVELVKLENAEPCDIILLRNGNEIQAKVLEVGLSSVKYKKCDNQEGPLIEIEKNDIFMITYSNGSKDVFKETLDSGQNQTPTKQVVSQPKKHGFAVASLIFGLLGIPLLAWIFGGIAKSLIRKYPEFYDGKGMANAGIFLGFLVFVIILIIVL